MGERKGPDRIGDGWAEWDAPKRCGGQVVLRTDTDEDYSTLQLIVGKHTQVLALDPHELKWLIRAATEALEMIEKGGDCD